MKLDHLELGLEGEGLAVDFLKRKGYKIRERDFRSPFGQIDIIADEKNTLCFIEVKTRSGTNFGLPEEAILPPKQTRIIKSALFYLKEKGLLDKRVRFDVVSILYEKANPRIKLIRNAFEERSQRCKTP